mgnify:CR=1 FL=1
MLAAQIAAGVGVGGHGLGAAGPGPKIAGARWLSERGIVAGSEVALPQWSAWSAEWGTAAPRTLRFDAAGAASETFQWKSKLFRFAEPTSFSAIMVEAAQTSAPAQRTDMTVLADDQYAVSLGNVAAANVAGKPHQYLVTIPDANFVSQNTNEAVVTIGAAATEDFTVRLYGDGALVHTFQRGLNRIQRVPSKAARQWQVDIRGTVEIMRLAMAQSAEEIWA